MDQTSAAAAAKPTIDTPFDDIPISTQTIIGVTNVTFNIVELYKQLNVSAYTVVPKRRGRRRKDEPAVESLVLEDGAIVTVKFGDAVRGTLLRPPKDNAKFFRNALTVVMFAHGKIVNFKISTNGKFQFTGCKSVDHAMVCVKHLWEQLLAMQKSEPRVYSFTDQTGAFMARFVTVMTNVDFRIGFAIDRQKLDAFVSQLGSEDFHSLLETSFGYSGLNLKVRIVGTPDFDVPVLTRGAGVAGQWSLQTIRNSQCVPAAPAPAPANPEDAAGRRAPRAKPTTIGLKHNTLLVFRSGSVIMSGANPELMRGSFAAFRDFVHTNRAHFELVE